MYVQIFYLIEHNFNVAVKVMHVLVTELGNRQHCFS